MLDIYDINYEYCSESLGILNLPPANLPKKGIGLRILSQIKGIIKYSFKFKKNKYIEKESVLFFVFAQNEINSVQSIVSEMPNCKYFGIDDYKNGYPISKIYWYSLIFIPIVFYRLIICTNPYHKRAFSYAFDGFCIAYASKYVLSKYFKKIKPSKIIIANQLSCYHRSLAYIAKDLNIETIYMQHASVTEKFGNLNIFSSALLEGEDSLVKYQLNGTKNKKIYLIGMPKSDKYFSHICEYEGINSVGVCTNGMDDISLFTELIVYLKENLTNIQVYVRPHPSDRRRLEWLDVAEKNNCIFSDVSKTDSFTFFKDIDLIVSGDSNIHLEATLLNIPSIYFDPQCLKLDWYGFVKNNLVFYASDIKNVGDYILITSFSGRDIRNKAKYYVDTVNSLFDGNSTKLATMIIQGDEIESYFISNKDNNNNMVYRVK